MAADPRHTTAFQIAREPRDLSGTLTEAYLMSDGAGAYVFGSGDKAGEATAFLQDDGTGALVFNDDAAEEDQKIYLVTTDTVVI